MEMKQPMSAKERSSAVEECFVLSAEIPNDLQSQGEKDFNEQDSSQGNSGKRPFGTKPAKKLKVHEDSFKMAAQAQIKGNG